LIHETIDFEEKYTFITDELDE